MSDARTRREFLKFSAAGLATRTVAQALARHEPSPPPAGGPGDITVRITDDSRLFESAPPLKWHPGPAKTTAEVVTLNPETKFQEILGFGAAFTDASCYMFDQLSADARGQLFQELFHPSQ